MKFITLNRTRKLNPTYKFYAREWQTQPNGLVRRMSNGKWEAWSGNKRAHGRTRRDAVQSWFKQFGR